MAGPGAVSPEIAAAMSAGRTGIGSSIEAGKRGLEGWMGTYNFQAPELYQALAERLGVAGGEAARDMDVSLKMSQLRQNLHDQRLKLLWEQLNRQRKDTRMNTYATALGAAGAIGGKAINMANNWRSSVQKPGPAMLPPVPSIDRNPYANPYLGLFDFGGV